MMKDHKLMCALILTSILTAQANAQTPDSVLAKVLEKLKIQSLMNANYGSYQQVRVRKFGSNSNTIKEEKVRLYRTIWIQNKPFNQLVKINGANLNASERAKESRRKSEFIKSPANSDSKTESGFQQEAKNIQWWNIYSRYTYTFIPPNSGAAFLISFKPKMQNFSTTSRLERVLKYVEGKIWIDRDFNILKAEASLQQPVNFGMGMLAQVQEMHTTYAQQKFRQIWIPASIHLTFQARIALLHTERQEVLVNWSELYARSQTKIPTMVAGGF